MEFILGNQRRGKIILISVLALIVFFFIFIFRLITGSFIVGTLLFVLIMYFLLRAVGTYVMYPGSSFYTRSDIQMRMSREISARMVLFFNSLHFLHLCVAQKKYISHQNQYDLIVVILHHITTMKEVLGMFEGSLSQRKIRMLAHYREIESIIEEKGEEDPYSIRQFIQQPRVIDNLTEQMSQFYRQKFEKIEQLMKNLHGIIKSYSPPDGTFSHLKFRMFEENLYELRFAFHTWNSGYNYELFIVPTSDQDRLQSAIIHNVVRKNYITGQLVSTQNKTKKAVLFCNPNGVFIQFFGFDNQYIRNYLRMGYHVILWNYRGYGQSTGSPTIQKSQLDAANVFRNYKNLGYEIQIVHGYSIGGAAAMGLFDHLSAETLAGVEILIIDRSFSSIGEMSVQFGSALHNITKCLFLNDNIDISKQFQGVKCRKLIIWDNIDEVIPDRASVKNRIMKRKRGLASNGSIYGIDEDLEVNQLNEEEHAPQPDFDSLIHKLAFTVHKLVHAKLQAQSGFGRTQQMEEKEEQRSEQSCNTSSTAPNLDNIEYLINIVNDIDGGGIELMREPEQLKALIARRPDRYHHICESYILGVVCYGSYYPLGPFIHDHKKIKQQTLQKLERAMARLRDKFQVEVHEPNTLFAKEADLRELVKNMYHIYFRLHQLVSDHFSEEWFQLHGSLLPTNNGHNCHLNELEIRILNDFIKTSIPQEMKEEKEVESNEEML